MACIFISHASADRTYALRLAHSLSQLGHSPWVDAEAIAVGASIPKHVSQAVEHADYLLALLTPRSVCSSWCEQEWYAKYWMEVVTRHDAVLPALLEDCVIPFFLRPKRYADFRSDFNVGFWQLTQALNQDGSARTLPGSVGASSSVAPKLPDTSVLVPLHNAHWYTETTMDRRNELVEVNVALEVPYIGSISGVWKPEKREQDAAWELYIELVTRVTVADLGPGVGLLRESLSSLYSIFTTTRQILRTYGPSIARPHDDSHLSFGYLAITILNYTLRPVLSKWHPLLLDHEHQRPASVSPLQHEASWDRADEMRVALRETQKGLLEYTKLLGEISRVPTTILQ